MKKIITAITALALILALTAVFTACGQTNEDKKDPAKADTAATAAVTEAAEDFDAEAIAADLQKQIVGNWTYYNWLYKTTSNHLVFNDDGTGSYQGGVVENGKYEFDYTFTYFRYN